MLNIVKTNFVKLKFVKGGKLFEKASETNAAILENILKVFEPGFCYDVEFEVMLFESAFFPEGKYIVTLTPSGIGIAEIIIDPNNPLRNIVIDRLTSFEENNIANGTILKNREGICHYPPMAVKLDDIEGIVAFRKMIAESQGMLKATKQGLLKATKRFIYYIDESCGKDILRIGFISYRYENEKFSFHLNCDPSDTQVYFDVI